MLSYEAIAEIINLQRKKFIGDKRYTRGYINATTDIAESLAHYFMIDNPDFENDIFLRDCGVIK